MTPKEKAWKEFEKAEKRFYFGMGVLSIIGFLSRIDFSLYHDDAFVVKSGGVVWLPLIMTSIAAILWWQCMFSGDNFIEKCD